MKQIHKFILKPVPGIQTIKMPWCIYCPDTVLDIQLQNGVICAWCLVDSSLPEHDVKFHVFETGDAENIDVNFKHIATVQLYNGVYVLHIFVEN